MIIVDYEAPSCTPRPIAAHRVTQGWSASDTGLRYPGPAFDGKPLASEATAHGFVAHGASQTNCPVTGTQLDLGSSGSDMVESWLRDPNTNNGITLRAAQGDASAWKTIGGTSGANAPSLMIAHSPYNATYSFAMPSFDPIILQNQDGHIKIDIRNTGAETWTPDNNYLAYTVFNANTGKPVSQNKAASLSTNVANGQNIVLDAVVKALPEGVYTIDFTMMAKGNISFTQEGVPPAQIGVQVFNIPPAVREMHPSNGWSAPTLNPQLWGVAVDVDAPAEEMRYKFTVEEMDEKVEKPIPGSAISTDAMANFVWTIPDGKLSWGKTYMWTVEITDKNGGKAVSPGSFFTTEVPQPLLQNGAAYSQEHPFDPSSGAFAQQAVDVSMAVAGTPLDLSRRYHSMDARRQGYFGAGWSSMLDMKVIEDKVTKSALVTMPDGAAVRFGKNTDGSFVSPAGSKSKLSGNSSGYILEMPGGAKYNFNGKNLSRIDLAGKPSIKLSYDYNEIVLSISSIDRKVVVATEAGKVRKVTLPKVDSDTPTWTYTYDGDLLKKVCGPQDECTQYEYSEGSLYATSVDASKPLAYWRLDEQGSKVAYSSNKNELGKYDGKYVGELKLREAPAQPKAGGGSIGLTGKGRIELPNGVLKAQRELAVEMWFNSNQSSVTRALLGYQDKPVSDTAKNGVPILYIGEDGRLYGQFAADQIKPITSAARVDNSKWHHVVLQSWGLEQKLFLDGKEVGTLSSPANHDQMTYAQIGVAQATGQWPSFGTGMKAGDFKVDNVAVYDRYLTSQVISDHWDFGNGGGNRLATITSPSGKAVAKIKYDDISGRVVEYVDGNDGKWRLGLPNTFGNKTDLRRSVMIYNPLNDVSMYEWDALTDRLLRSASPAGNGVKQRPIPTPPTSTPSTPANKSDCIGGVPEDGDFCVFTLGADPGKVSLVAIDLEGMAVRSFHYDKKGRMTKIVNEIGASTEMQYDDRGNMIQQTHRKKRNDQQTQSHQYFKYAGGFSDPRDPRWDKVIEQRNGLASGPDDPLHVIKTVYDQAGREIRRTGVDTVSSQTEYGFNSHDFALPVRSQDGHGKNTYLEYNSFGDLTKISEETGAVTEFSYDAMGRKISQTVSGKNGSKKETSVYKYDLKNRLLEEVAPESVDAVTGEKHQLKSSFEYNKDGQVLKTVVQDIVGTSGIRTSTRDYDPLGRVQRIIDPKGGETHLTYDIMGNTTSVTDAEGRKRTFAYTSRNKVGEEKVMLDAFRSLVTTNFYDNAGRLVYKYDAMGRKLQFKYNDDDSLNSVALNKLMVDGTTQENIEIQHKEYDKAGHVILESGLKGGSVIKYDYDQFERVLGVTHDPNGAARRIKNTYDAQGNVIETEHSGYATGYDSKDTISNSGNKVSYSYDDYGRKISESQTAYQETHTTSYELDEFGRVISTTSPAGNLPGADKALYTTRFDVDLKGRVVKISTPPRKAETYGSAVVSVAPETVTGYDGFGNVAHIKSPDGLVSTTWYDELDRVVAKESPAYRVPGGDEIKPMVKFEYSKTGSLTKQIDPIGRESTFEYDATSKLISKTVPASGNSKKATWRYEYTNAGYPQKVIAPDGAESYTNYDELDRIIEQVRVERVPEKVNLVSKVAYDDFGNVKSRTNAKGETTTFEYSSVDEMIKNTNAAGVTTEFGFDQFGKQIISVDGSGRPERTIYDYFGRVQKVNDHDASGKILRSHSYVYDFEGRTKEAIDALGKKTVFEYDNIGQILSQIEPVADSKTITTSFGYDVLGRRTKYVDGRGNASWTTYNTLGLIEAVVEPSTALHPAENDRKWVAKYNALGQSVEMVAPGGTVRKRTFDDGGALLSEQGTGGGASEAKREFTYDVMGRVKTLSSPRGTDNFEYNDAGQLVKALGPSGQSDYSYDEVGRVATRKDASGVQTYKYDKGMLSSISDELTGLAIGYGYNKLGQVEKLDYGLGRTRSFSYDDLGRLSSDSVINPAGETVAKIEYGYDLGNSVTSKRTTGYGKKSQELYTYDDASRLRTWALDGVTTLYEYDDSGNRTRSGEKTATYDERNRLIKSGDAEYKYSARGTLEQKKTKSETVIFSFDAFDRMISDGKNTTKYDSLDRMDSTEGKDITYSGLSADPIAVGDTQYSRTVSGALLGSKIGKTTRLLVSDQHTDVVGAFDPGEASLKELSDTKKFDPWGVPGKDESLKTSFLDGSQLGFQGDWTASGTGLVNMGARWYDPGEGQFISRDTVTGDGPSVRMNRYAYAWDNPVTHNDPDGHWPGWLDRGVNRVVNTVKDVARSVGHAIVQGVNAVVNTVVKVATWVNNNVIKPAIAAFNHYVWQPLKKFAGQAWQGAKTLANMAWSSAKQLAADTKRYAERKAEEYKAVVTAVAKATIQTAVRFNPVPMVQNAVNRVTEHVNKMVQAAKEFPARVVSVYKDVTASVAAVTQVMLNAVSVAADVVVGGIKSGAQWVGEHPLAAAGMAVSLIGAVGCSVATAGVGAVACFMAAGAVAGALSGIDSCPPGQSKVGCAAKSGLVGAVTGLLDAVPGLGFVGKLAMSGVQGGIGVAGDAWIQGRSASAEDIASGAFMGQAGHLLGAGASKAAGAAGQGLQKLLGGRAAGAADLAVSAPSHGGSVARSAAPEVQSFSGGGCPLNSFSGDTPVVMANGSTKAIKDVQLDDQIASQDPVTGKNSAQKVVRTIKHAVAGAAMVAVTLSSGVTVDATAEHPFMAPDLGLASSHAVAAKDLKPGDQLTTEDGSKTTVVQTRVYTTSQTVYNLTVDHTHTYILGTGEKPVVHSTCGFLEAVEEELNHMREEVSGGNVNHVFEGGR